MKMLHQFGVNAWLEAQDTNVVPNCNVVPLIRHEERQRPGRLQLEIATQNLEGEIAALDQLRLDDLADSNACGEQINLERTHRMLCELKLTLENIKWYRSQQAKRERIT